MRVKTAKKSTKCSYCKEEIAPGENVGRLDQKIKRGEKYYELHYHLNKPGQEVSCFELYAREAFNRIPDEQRKYASNNPRGRPKLDLTDEQRARRRKLLRRLHNQFAYYIKGGKLNLDPKPIYELTQQDVRRYGKFSSNVYSLLEELKECGGIPPKLRSFSSALMDVE